MTPDISTTLRDVAAEAAVLGSAMLQPGIVADLRDVLKPDDFGKPEHTVIWEAMLAIDAVKGSEISPMTVRLQLDRTKTLQRAGGVEYLSDLAGQTPSASAYAYYATIVQEFSARRTLMATAEALRAAASDIGVPVQQAVDNASESLLGATATASEGVPLSTQTEALDTWWKQLEEAQAHSDGITGITSGFQSVDAMTTGWHPGDLIYVAARPSVGKTTFLGHLTMNAAANGKNVVFVSIEMTVADIVCRMVASTGSIDEHAMRAGLAGAREFDAAARTVEGMRSLPITWMEPPTMTVRALRVACRRLKAQGKLDLLVVDQLGKLQPDRPDTNRNNIVSGFSEGMRLIARELNVPVICAHQLSRDVERREGEGRVPRLVDLRDSGTLEQDATTVIFLHREWDPDKDGSTGIMSIKLAKTRRGPIGTAQLFYTGSYTQFSDPPARKVQSIPASIVDHPAITPHWQDSIA